MNANIPNDPIMLLSFINMKLRDIYPSLEALCEDMDIREEELAEKLRAAGFEYDKEQNRFR
ncbi:MAG: DUF4250 domain-containing protein [Oscillospiraceae bacterium]|nr:DUF4250 domain-containing protein [Oscillospiraceae bacterium]